MIIVGVDLGHARTGLAVCDKGELLASPLGVIAQRDPEKLARQVAEAAQRAKAERLAVGLPRNMDGTEGHHRHGPRLFERDQHPGQKAQGCGGRGGGCGDFGGLSAVEEEPSGGVV